MAKKRRTTFLKTQKERARLEIAPGTEVRVRRQGRETDVPGDPSFAGPQPLTETLPEVLPPPV